MTASKTDAINSTSMGASSVLGSGYETGDLTYYVLGLGDCGQDDTGNNITDNIVAMSSEVMGLESNTNPMCGMTIRIYNTVNGRTSTGLEGLEERLPTKEQSARMRPNCISPGPGPYDSLAMPLYASKVPTPHTGPRPSLITPGDLTLMETNATRKG
jgi:hypothetical protein